MKNIETKENILAFSIILLIVGGISFVSGASHLYDIGRNYNTALFFMAFGFLLLIFSVVEFVRFSESKFEEDVKNAEK